MLEIVFRYESDPDAVQERPATAEQAVARLIEGNRQFARLWSSGGSDHREVIPFDGRLWGLHRGPDELPGQQPFGAVLACSDARVPTELVFHRTLNDLFVVRLAGNVVSAEGLGSLSYAAGNLAGSMRVVVVLGHMGCGAVTAAVDAYLTPGSYTGILSDLGLRAIVDRILIAVRMAAGALDPGAPDYRQRLIESTVVLHAAVTASTVRDQLHDWIESGGRVVWGVHDPGNGVVSAPGEDGALTPGLTAPLPTPDAIQRLAGQLGARPK